MIILKARFGYVIHNKVTDTYTDVVYLPNKKQLDNYEEVPRDDIDFEVYERITNLQEDNKLLQEDNKVLHKDNKELHRAKDELIQKNQSLTKVAKVVANQVTDDVVALEIQEFYDEWQVGVTYVVGQYIRFEEVLYKVLNAHTSQEGWNPSQAPSLFAKVLTDPNGAILDWVQPDSTNPYMKGDKVKFDGKTYVSTVDNNVWQPGVYGWEITE